MHTFLQFDEENWKKYRIMSKKLIFVQTYKIYVDAMATSKNHWHTINVSKFPRRLNEQLLKVSALLSKSAFKNFEKKNLMWEVASTHPSP